MVCFGELCACAIAVRRKLNSNFILATPDNPARVTWVSVTRQPKTEYVRYVVAFFFKRQFRAAVGYVYQCAVS